MGILHYKSILLACLALCMTAFQQHALADGCTGSTFNIQYSPACGCWQVCGNFISDCEEIKSIDWDFGDGGTATGKEPCHTYTQPGTYTVTMNIRACCHATFPLFPCSSIQNCQISNNVTVTQAQINNNGPQADFTADTVCLGTATQFTNQSQFANNFTWLFPDGTTSNQPNPTYTFDSCGVYEQEIALIASDNTCCDSPSFDTIRKQVFVKCPPNTPANANADSSDFIFESSASIIEDTVCHTEPLQFDLAASDSIVNWQWTFSDGGSSSMRAPQHVFDSCGANAQPPNFGEVAVTTTQGCVDTVREFVEVFCPFEFSGLVTNQGCNRQGGIILQFQGSSAALEYSNDYGQTFQSDSNYWFPLSPGQYGVVVRDTFQVCSKSDTFTVGLDAGPAIFEIDSMNPGCTGGFNNGFVDISDSGGLAPITYQWSNGASTQDINNLSPGTYSVTIEDANNCRDQATVTLNPYNASLSISEGCNGANNGAIDVTVTGGSPPFSYNWSNSLPSTQDQNNLSPGNYSVTITDANGCTLIEDTTIVEPPPLQSDFSVSQFASGSNISCFDSTDGFIDLMVQGGTPSYSYNWNNGQFNTQDLNNIPAGNYQVTITDDNGCTLTADTILTQPPPIITSVTVSTFVGGDNVSCNGANDGFINLSASGSGLSYAWSNGNNSQNLNNIPAGSYSVTVTNPNGCANSIDTVLSEPPPLTDSATVTEFNGGFNVSCNGGSDGAIDLFVSGGTPPYSYSWNTGAVTQDISNIPAGSYSLTITDTNGCTEIFDTVLTEPPPIVDSMIVSQFPGGYNVSCNGANDGWIDVGVKGGVPPYSYIWPNMPDTVNAQDTSGLMAGSYTVFIADQNACVQRMDTTLTEPPPLDLDFSISSFPNGNNISCSGGSDGFINLTVNGGSPGYDYAWSTGDTTRNIDSIPAGQYSVTVTDTNGCMISGDTTLTQPQPLGISATLSQFAGGFNVSCFGSSDGFIDLTVNGGTTPYSYSWNGGAFTTQDLNGVPADTFSVLVTDANGCTITLDTALTEPPPLSNTWSTSAFPGGWEISCHGGSDGSIDLTVNGGVAPYDYSWNGGAFTTQDISNVPAGNYAVTITDTNGCSLVIDTTLTEPPPLTPSAELSLFQGDNNISCFGFSDGFIDVSVSGGTSPYSYSWNTGASTQDLSNIPAGQYSVTVTDTNGCSTVLDTTLTQPQPITTNLSISNFEGGVNVSCHNFENGYIDLSASGGSQPYTYQWNNGLGTTQDIDSIGAGTYIVQVTDTNGCTTQDTTTLTEPPPINATSQSEDVTCNNGKDGLVSVSATGGTPFYEFQWSNGETDSVIANVPAGNYSATVTDANNCQTQIQQQVFEPDPIEVRAEPSHEIRFGDTAQIETQHFTNGKDVASWEWLPKTDLSCTDCPEPKAFPLNTTTYTLTMVDEDGCVDTAQTIINVDNTKIFFVPNAFTPNGDDLNDRFRVFARGVKSFKLQIFNRWGELVFESHDKDVGWDGIHNGEESNPGVFVYVVRVNYLDGETIQKSGSLTLIR